MIKIRLSDLLGKHKMTQKALSEITGIRPATISKMYYEEVKRIDVRHLNNICKAFDCEISELLEYIKKPVLTIARNSMGCDENWYNSYFAIKETFSIEEINSMSDKEVANLVRLGDSMSEAFY